MGNALCPQWRADHPPESLNSKRGCHVLLNTVCAVDISFVFGIIDKHDVEPACHQRCNYSEDYLLDANDHYHHDPIDVVDYMEDCLPLKEGLVLVVVDRLVREHLPLIPKYQLRNHPKNHYRSRLQRYVEGEPVENHLDCHHVWVFYQSILLVPAEPVIHVVVQVLLYIINVPVHSARPHPKVVPCKLARHPHHTRPQNTNHD